MVRKPLIDGDIVVYEASFKSQTKDENGEVIPFSVEKAYQNLDDLVSYICKSCKATEPPTLFFTGANNFRKELSKEVEYKANRKDKEKPFHYYNLVAYAKAVYEYEVSDVLEADDLLSIRQREAPPLTTIICSRDKDLRIVPGMHFGWEVADQPRYGPKRVYEAGEIFLKNNTKLVGNGTKFFYSQCLTGDRADHIMGVRGYGPVKAYKELFHLNTIKEMEERVKQIYISKYGEEEGLKLLLERGRLLWMTDELHEDGSPVLWEFERWNAKEPKNEE